MRVVRFLVCILLVGLMGPALAQAVAPGVVDGPARMSGAWMATFPSEDAIQPRDIFDVVRGGKTIGQVMVLSLEGQGSVVVPTASFGGTLQKGDALQFSRHAAVPTTPPPAPQLPTGTVVADEPQSAPLQGGDIPTDLTTGHAGSIGSNDSAPAWGGSYYPGSYPYYPYQGTAPYKLYQPVPGAAYPVAPNFTPYQPNGWLTPYRGMSNGMDSPMRGYAR